MTPAARIAAAIELLDLIRAGRAPMDTLIGDYMRGRRYIGSKDRQAIADTVYAVMRSHARLSWWCGRLDCDDTSRTRILLWLVLGEAMPFKHIESRFDGSRYGSHVLSDDEYSLLQALEGQPLTHHDMPAAVQVECPRAYEEDLRARFGELFADEMAAMCAPAPIDLRVNTTHANRDDVKAMLADDGVEAHPTPYSPWGLRIAERVHLAPTRAYKKRLISIQDEGAQLIAQACDVGPGMKVLDYCAGAGGKTLALANTMNGKGRLVATDTDNMRLANAEPRLRRQGLHDCVELRGLDDPRHRKWLKRQKGVFDVVLADVPCTGTGTWRRNPDQRWFRRGPALAELQQDQADILTRIASKVRPGGRIVYATCSLLPAENEDQIQALLDQHPEFRLMNPPHVPGDKDGFMRLSPHRHGTDGFFAAVLQRLAA
jgi:16S rRNA (cytosine967-C5)-methyltransferase